MRRSCPLGVVISTALILLVAAAAVQAGDRFWSTLPGMSGVNDLAICGTSVYAATESGLYRSTGDPEDWLLLRSAWTTHVACCDSKVIWQEILFTKARAVTYSIYVSHDALQTVTPVAGLTDITASGSLRNLAIAGTTALAAERHGVFRSTDGGFNFATQPVLWNSTGGYAITAVWTNGTACAASGSGGSTANGVWYSATGAAGTFSLVLDVYGLGWLDGHGTSTLVAGCLSCGGYDAGYRSTDGGATWGQLPASWPTAIASYQRPFVSGSILLSHQARAIFDSGSGQWITYVDGPNIFDLAQDLGSNMDAGYFSDEDIEFHAIIENAAPVLLVTEYDGPVHWYRIPGGWPVGGFDFTPPSSGALDVSPRVKTSAPQTSVTLQPSAFDAARLFVAERFDGLSITYNNGFSATNVSMWGPMTNDWVPFTTSLQWDTYPANGSHTFFAWYEDAEGNATDPAVLAGSSNFPETLNLGSSGAWGAWIYAPAGESFTIGASGAGGDIDVYHWEPNSTWSDDWAANPGHDTLSFTTRATGYHLVILWNYPGSGGFSGPVTVSPSLLATATSRGRQARPSESQTLTPPDAVPLRFQENPTNVFSDDFESGTTSEWSGTEP
ncbi:MAG: hypothetical protein K8R59_12975 [Thermoanaerobaculales bacterium]|nr:hypothetical protein [Thermoanaerobaculales bacterium]